MTNLQANDKFEGAVENSQSSLKPSEKPADDIVGPQDIPADIPNQVEKSRNSSNDLNDENKKVSKIEEIEDSGNQNEPIVEFGEKNATQDDQGPDKDDSSDQEISTTEKVGDNIAEEAESQKSENINSDSPDGKEQKIDDSSPQEISATEKAGQKIAVEAESQKSETVDSDSLHANEHIKDDPSRDISNGDYADAEMNESSNEKDQVVEAEESKEKSRDDTLEFNEDNVDYHLEALKSAMSNLFRPLSEDETFEKSKNYMLSFNQFYLKNLSDDLSADDESLRLSFKLLNYLIESDPENTRINRVLSTIAILSRNLDSELSENEKNIKTLLNMLYGNSLSPLVAAHTLRALVNYAEVHVEILDQNSALGIITSYLRKFLSNPDIQISALLVLRNMSVSETLHSKMRANMFTAILSSVSANSMDSRICENAFWVMGNIVRTIGEEEDPNISSLLPMIKEAINLHIQDASTIEAACWLLFNLTFNNEYLRQVMRLMYEETMLKVYSTHKDQEEIQKWSTTIIQKIRAIFTAGTAEAASQRHENTSIMEGYMEIKNTGFSKKFKKRFFVLQPGRLFYCKSESDTEICREILLLDILEVRIGNDKSIFLKTSQNDLLLFCESEEQALDWLRNIKLCWKKAVNFINVNRNASATDEIISLILDEKELNHYCTFKMLEEVQMSPMFKFFRFSSQEKFPYLNIRDYFMAKFTREKVDDLLSGDLSGFKLVDNNDMFDATSLDVQIEKIVDDKLVSEAGEFDKNPELMEENIPLTSYEMCAKQGLRPNMEDQHCHIPYLNELINLSSEQRISFYSIYDGHGGQHVAEYLSRSLHYKIIEHSEFDHNFAKALKDSYMSTQEDLEKVYQKFKYPASVGSTSLTIFFKGNKMLVGWAGDSMAALFTNKKDFMVMDPHKPFQEKEKKRIENLGGYVSDEDGVTRVNGAVAVSRSFGNFKHSSIIPEADVNEFDLEGNEEFLILACDGLWDVMDVQNIRKFAQAYKRKHSGYVGISEALVNNALKLGSTDNVSVIFVEFLPKKPHKELDAEREESDPNPETDA